MFALNDLFGVLALRPRRVPKAARVAAAAKAVVETLEVRQMLSSYWITADTGQAPEHGTGSVTLHAVPDTGEDTTWTVNFGDGTPSVTVGFPAGDESDPGTLNVGHVFQAEEGQTCHVTAQVEETGCVNGEWIDTFYDATPADMSIVDAPISVSAQSISMTEWQPYDPSDGPIGTITDANPSADVGDFPTGSVTVNWGDGGTSQASVVAQGGGNFLVELPANDTHTYDAPGTYHATLSANDRGGSSKNVNFDVVVNSGRLKLVEGNITSGKNVVGNVQGGNVTLNQNANGSVSIQLVDQKDRPIAKAGIGLRVTNEVPNPTPFVDYALGATDSSGKATLNLTWKATGITTLTVSVMNKDGSLGPPLTITINCQ